MGGYVMIDKDLVEDPRVRDLADALARTHFGLTGTPPYTAEQLAGLGLARNAVLGGLYRLWAYADTYLGRHDRLKSALHGSARIEEVTALPALLLSRFPPEWLRIHEDGSIELPGYAAKNGLIDRDQRREQTRLRVRRHRKKKRQEQESGNTLHSVTDEALQRYKSVTTGPGPDRTGPDLQTGPDRDRTDSAASPSPATADSAAPEKAQGWNDGVVEQLLARKKVSV